MTPEHAEDKESSRMQVLVADVEVCVAIVAAHLVEEPGSEPLRDLVGRVAVAKPSVGCLAGLPVDARLPVRRCRLTRRGSGTGR